MWDPAGDEQGEPVEAHLRPLCELLERYGEDRLRQVVTNPHDLAWAALETGPEHFRAMLDYLADLCDDGCAWILRRAIRLVGSLEEFQEVAQHRRGRYGVGSLTLCYLHLKSALAEELLIEDRIGESIDQYEDMLELDHDDTLDARVRLLEIHLEWCHLQLADELIARYEGHDACMRWGRVLERLLYGDRAGAETALEAAMRANPHVAGFLLGRRALPCPEELRRLAGEVREGFHHAMALGSAWEAWPHAVRWLGRRV